MIFLCNKLYVLELALYCRLAWTYFVPEWWVYVYVYIHSFYLLNSMFLCMYTNIQVYVYIYTYICAFNIGCMKEHEGDF